jgi:anti-sigma B factor antagonist
MPSETRRHIRVTDVNDVSVVGFTAPDSVFQTKDVQELDDELNQLVSEEGRTRLLLNLNGIRYFSSSILVRLINLKKKVELADGKFAICCLTPVMRDTFRVSKLDTLFEIYEDESGALAQF